MEFGSVKLLSFDCYGTLIDWETGILNAMRPLLESHGKIVSDNEILETHAELEPRAQSSKYRPYREILGEVVKGFGQKYLFETSVREIESLGESVSRWPAFADSSEALKRLQDRYLLMIISNIDDDLIKSSTARLDVDFDYIITAQMAKRYKPDTRVFEFAYNRVDVDTSHVLHVAQSLFHDVEPANRLGLNTAWVNRRKGQAGWGATPSSSAKPTLEVASMSELAETLSRP